MTVRTANFALVDLGLDVRGEDTHHLFLNLAYSFWLKRLVVIDCMCIALGFQLRVQAGAAAIGVDASHWLLLCTFFFSLFLAFCKRYEEVGRQVEARAELSFLRGGEPSALSDSKDITLYGLGALRWDSVQRAASDGATLCMSRLMGKLYGEMPSTGPTGS